MPGGRTTSRAMSYTLLSSYSSCFVFTKHPVQLKTITTCFQNMFFSKKAPKQKGGCLDTLDSPPPWICHWWDGQVVSVRLSVPSCESYEPQQQHSAGLMLSAVRAGDISQQRQAVGAQQQQYHCMVRNSKCGRCPVDSQDDEVEVYLWYCDQVTSRRRLSEDCWWHFCLTILIISYVNSYRDIDSYVTILPSLPT